MKIKIIASLLAITSWVVIQACQSTSSVVPEPVRTIVTTDGEIDDVDSFIRMLLYSNEFKLEGLIYSSSMWHYRGDGKGTPFISKMEMTRKIYGTKTNLRWPGTQWMQELIAAYKRIYPNLILHDSNFPEPDSLLSMIKVGNINFEGDMDQATEGSDWIKAKLLDDQPGPIYLQAWGGTNTIARALKSIEEEYANGSDWNLLKERVSQKAIIYTIMDQDATYKDYIAVHWPEIKILYNTSQFWCLAYAWKRYLSKEELRYFEGEFMKNEIIKDHGPLLEKYYSYGDGQKQVGDDEHVHGDSTRLVNAQWGTFNQFDFISEGDSPAFLFLLSNGLNDVSHPEYGGWGGRFVAAKEKPNFFADGDEATDFNPLSGQADKIYPQSRWIKVLQEDFAARADWCIKPYAKANHPPVVHIKGDANRIAKPGSEVRVAINSEDPDGDKVTIRVWPYAEAGNGAVEVSYEEGQIKVKIPSDAAIGNQYHVVIEGKDNAEKPMTRYARLVLSVSGLN